MEKAYLPLGKVFFGVLLAIIAGSWFAYQSATTNHHLSLQVEELQRRLAQHEQALSASKKRIAELESELLARSQELEAVAKKSLPGLLEETNNSVIQGWQKLLDAVNQELGKARNEIEGALKELGDKALGEKKPETRELPEKQKLPEPEREKRAEEGIQSRAADTFETPSLVYREK